MVEYCKLLGQRSTSRLFSISQKRLYEWMKNLPEKPQPSTSTKNNAVQVQIPATNTSGVSLTRRTIRSQKSSIKQVIDMNIEQDIYNWYINTKQQQNKCTSTLIRNKAREFYRNKGYTSIQCSYGWYRRWCNRFTISTSPHSNTDDIILTWLLKQYDQNNLITYKKLQQFTKQLFPNSSSRGQEESSSSLFKASNGWATRFFKRNHLLINWYGYYSKLLPVELENNVQIFLQEFNNKLLQESKNTKKDEEIIIASMDEIPLSFATTNLPSDKQRNITDNICKVSRLRRISIKNCEATVILCILNNGIIIPPMIIVKRQEHLPSASTSSSSSSSCPTTKNQFYSKTDNPIVVYYAEQNTEPTIKSIEKWLELNLIKELSCLKQQQPQNKLLLLWDSYLIHLQVKDKCNEIGIESIIFPEGCSCKLQPINVAVRKLFLKLIDEEWKNYLQTNNANQSIKIHLPTTDDIVEWVYKAFISLKTKQELIKDSFSILMTDTNATPQQQKNPVK